MIYKIPLSERFTKIGSGYSHKEKLMEVDGIGLYVEYRGNEEDNDFSDENIRRHLIGIRSTHCTIIASSPQEAIDKFHSEYDGAKIGTKAKALYIDTKDFYYIEEFPSCKLLHKQESGNIVCYNPDWEDDDVTIETCTMGCTINGNVPPKNCPIKQYRKFKEYSYYIDNVYGYKVKRINLEKLSLSDISKNYKLFNKNLDEIGNIFYKAKRLQKKIIKNRFIKKDI